MGFVAPVIAGVGALVGARQQRKAAQSASDAQVSVNQASIDEQRRQYDNNRKLLEPYVNVGVSALGQHNDLLGLNGAEKQQGAMNSRHLTGNAVDLVAIVDGQVSWDFNHYYTIAKAMAQASTELGVTARWGGTWMNINRKDGTPQDWFKVYKAERK